MPYVRIETNVARPAVPVSELVEALTRIVHEVKPEVQRAGIAVSLHHGLDVAFGGDASSPAIIATVTNAVMPHAVTLPLTERLTSELEKAYGARSTRIYVFFRETHGAHLVGLMGKTFVELTGG